MSVLLGLFLLLMDLFEVFCDPFSELSLEDELDDDELDELSGGSGSAAAFDFFLAGDLVGWS